MTLREFLHMVSPATSIRVYRWGRLRDPIIVLANLGRLSAALDLLDDKVAIVSAQDFDDLPYLTIVLENPQPGTLA
jgi:hypothetical protein